MIDSKIFSTLAVLIFCSGCAFKFVTRSKNIEYLPANGEQSGQPLNIFSESGSKSDEVLIFIHGGSWRSGSKKLYSFLGNRFARKNIVVVIVDYPLGPSADYNDMAQASAASVKWVQENIAEYGGDPLKIYVSGHSAGGHLAALISVRQEYFDSLQIPSPIKGTILIDAAGLDMHRYSQERNLQKDHVYMKIFLDRPPGV